MLPALSHPLVVAALGAALPAILAGILTVPLVDRLKRAWAALDTAPPWAKQLVVGVLAPALAAVLQQLAARLGADGALPTTLAALTVERVTALLAAVLAYALKAGQQARAARQVAGYALARAHGLSVDAALPAAITTRGPARAGVWPIPHGPAGVRIDPSAPPDPAALAVPGTQDADQVPVGPTIYEVDAHGRVTP